MVTRCRVEWSGSATGVEGEVVAATTVLGVGVCVFDRRRGYVSSLDRAVVYVPTLTSIEIVRALLLAGYTVAFGELLAQGEG